MKYRNEIKALILIALAAFLAIISSCSKPKKPPFIVTFKSIQSSSCNGGATLYEYTDKHGYTGNFCDCKDYNIGDTL